MLFWTVGILLAFIVLIIAVLFIERFLIAAPRYKGQVSDHFNGTTFFNRDKVQSSLIGLLKWVTNRDQGEWSIEDWNTRTDAPFGTPPPNRVGDGINVGKVRITFINHATMLIQTDGLNILTDPVWSERVSPFGFMGPKRARPAGIRLEDLPPIDVILLSHNHYDHLDVATLKTLVAAHKPRIFTTLGVGLLLEQEGIPIAGELDWWQSCRLVDDVKLHCVPAQHFSGRGFSDRNATLWCGFVVASATSGNIYFVGDSGYNVHFKQIREKFGAFRVAMIPIGAFRPEWFMSPVHISPREAVQVFQDIGAPLSIAMHYGTFPLADDGEREPVTALHAALKTAGIDSTRFVALREGEGWDFGR